MSRTPHPPLILPLDGRPHIIEQVRIMALPEWHEAHPRLVADGTADPLVGSWPVIVFRQASTVTPTSGVAASLASSRHQTGRYGSEPPGSERSMT
ncbi:MAG: hypothetical protein ABT940_12725 [Alphaproteobacteria bacterium]